MYVNIPYMDRKGMVNCMEREIGKFSVLNCGIQSAGPSGSATGFLTVRRCLFDVFLTTASTQISRGFLLTLIYFGNFHELLRGFHDHYPRNDPCFCCLWVNFSHRGMASFRGSSSSQHGLRRLVGSRASQNGAPHAQRRRELHRFAFGRGTLEVFGSFCFLVMKRYEKNHRIHGTGIFTWHENHTNQPFV